MRDFETTAIQRAEIAILCPRHRVRRLTWSDEPIRTEPNAGEAAMLIEFTFADMPALDKPAAMEEEVSRILGRKTDLHLYLRELYLRYGPSEAAIEYDRADYMEIPMPKDKIAEFCRRKKSGGWPSYHARAAQLSPTTPMLISWRNSNRELAWAGRYSQWATS